MAIAAAEAVAAPCMNNMHSGLNGVQQPCGLARSKRGVSPALGHGSLCQLGTPQRV